MVPNEAGLLVPSPIINQLRRRNDLHDNSQEARRRFGASEDGPLVLPIHDTNYRYTICQFLKEKSIVPLRLHISPSFAFKNNLSEYRSRFGYFS